MYLSRLLLLAALLAAVALTGCKQPADDLDAFLADYNVLYRDLWQRAEGARWDANVDVGEATSAARVAADAPTPYDRALRLQAYLRRGGAHRGLCRVRRSPGGEPAARQARDRRAPR